jgi:hypothetical protein
MPGYLTNLFSRIEAFSASSDDAPSVKVLVHIELSKSVRD